MRGILALGFLLIWATSFPTMAQMPNGILKPGTVFKDCKICPEMIVVPKGLYIIGLGGKNRHGPPRRIVINKTFAVGRYEITFDEWYACLLEEGCQHQPDDHNWGTQRRPVINITLEQTKNFNRWLSRKTGKKYRLPSEAEWEYVARAGTTTQFWWGDNPGHKMANCRDCESRACCSAKEHSCCSKSTKPVGSFPANQFGLFDTAGNVFEWTEDCWNPSHRNRPVDPRARKDGECANQVIRGGSFYYKWHVVQAPQRPGVLSVVRCPLTETCHVPCGVR